MTFDEWWNSSAADAFRAQHPDADGRDFQCIWDAAAEALRAPVPPAALGRPPERADMEAWANVAGLGEYNASRTFWFYRNGGDGLWEAYCAGAGAQRARDAVAGRDYLNAALSGLRA